MTTTQGTHWSRQGLGGSPAAGHAVEDDVLVDTSLFSPEGYGRGDALVAQHVVDSGVTKLLLGRGPSHVAGFVIAVIVDTVNRVFPRWALTHVRKEIAEGCTPALAHFDAPSAVVAVLAVALLVAPRQDAPPDAVLRSVGVPVQLGHLGEMYRGSALTPVATARSRDALIQQPALNDQGQAAVATALPLSAPVDGADVLNGDKSTEPLAEHVLVFHATILTDMPPDWWEESGTLAFLSEFGIAV